MSTDEYTQQLARGAACVQCRQRKIKCDGQRPICRQCNRANRQAECEYRDTRAPSNARALEQHIARLETRIQELSADNNSVRLQNPYMPFLAAATGSQSAAQASGLVPTNIAQILVQLFLPHSSKFGFFIHIPRLIDSFRNDTGASAANPATLLRSVICLFGIRLSRNASYATEENNLLTGILQHLHPALSAARDDRRATLYVLQSEILLSYYFFDNNRLLEGRLHTQAAVSLAMICRLHKGPNTGAATDILATETTWLPPPLDITEYKERVNGWWQTFVLDKSWAVALASPSMIEERDGSETIDTPWPLRDGDNDLGAGLFHQTTLQRFFENVILDTNTSHLGLHAQAAALYERAHSMASYQHRNLPQYDAAVAALDTSIECFIQILPALQQPNAQGQNVDARTQAAFVLVHTLMHCAAIQLHIGQTGHNAAAMTRCFAAAKTVAGLAQHFDVASIKCVNPITAVLWASAADALVQCLRALSNFDRSGPGASLPSMPTRETIIEALNKLTASMAAFGQVSPLFGDQLSKLQHVLNAL